MRKYCTPQNIALFSRYKQEASKKYSSNKHFVHVHTIFPRTNKLLRQLRKQTMRKKEKKICHTFMAHTQNFMSEFDFFFVLFYKNYFIAAFAVIGKKTTFNLTRHPPTTLISNFLTGLNGTQGSFRV